MTRFILDASVALSWFLDVPPSAFAGRVRQSLLAGARAVVPSLWPMELANGLVVAQRRGLQSADDIDRAVVDLERVIAQAIESMTDSFSIRQLLDTARLSQLTAYDAAYLETARREGLPLATLDQRLREAAAKAGVKLVR